MAIPAKNVLGNPNVTEGNYQIAIEQLRESVVGSGKAYDSANTYSQYDTCVYGGIIYYSKINSNTGNTPAINANWGLIGDLFNLLINNGTAFGYGTGSGGTVTQLTSKSTPVTLNKPSGQITTSNSSLASGTTTSFYLNNSLLSIGDNLSINCSSHANYSVRARIGAGAAEIIIIQNSGSTLSEAIVINYSVIKGATA